MRVDPDLTKIFFSTSGALDFWGKRRHAPGYLYNGRACASGRQGTLKIAHRLQRNNGVTAQDKNHKTTMYELRGGGGGHCIETEPDQRGNRVLETS